MDGVTKIGLVALHLAIQVASSLATGFGARVGVRHNRDRAVFAWGLLYRWGDDRLLWCLTLLLGRWRVG